MKYLWNCWCEYSEVRTEIYFCLSSYQRGSYCTSLPCQDLLIHLPGSNYNNPDHHEKIDTDILYFISKCGQRLHTDCLLIDVYCPVPCRNIPSLTLIPVVYYLSRMEPTDQRGAGTIFTELWIWILLIRFLSSLKDKIIKWTAKWTPWTWYAGNEVELDWSPVVISWYPLRWTS